MNKFNRRNLLKTSFLGAFLTYFAKDGMAINSTPTETKGPFYPVTPQKDKDFDLTTIVGNKERAKGQIVNIIGKVIDKNSNPIENATVDIWQANAAGRYRHPHDSNPAPLDSNFQGWAIVQSGEEGLFKFKTIIPGAYPVSKTWTRPPHIHFKVTKRGYTELVTQMYFPDNELNKNDLLLQRKTKDEQGLMVAKRVEGKHNTLEYTVILSSV